MAIGVMREDVGPYNQHQAAGAIGIIHGVMPGYDYLDAPYSGWHQDVGAIKDNADSYDLFGASLAAGDFDGDGYDDLAIGVPGEDLDGIENAGAVNVLYGGFEGFFDTLETENQLWTQDSPDIKDSAEPGDGFGG